jgi:hypothetical protein
MGLVQAFPILFVALMATSLLAAVAGIYLGRAPRRRIDAHVVYALKLCPLLTLVFLGIVGLASILYSVGWWP